MSDFNPHSDSRAILARSFIAIPNYAPRYIVGVKNGKPFSRYFRTGHDARHYVAYYEHEIESISAVTRAD